jgi:Protein of unknown function (DUF2794)
LNFNTTHATLDFNNLATRTDTKQEVPLSSSDPITFRPRLAFTSPLTSPSSGAAPQAPTQSQASPSQASQPSQTRFDRHELNTILNLYGKKVAAGEWRDYAIDFNRDTAVFSVFRHSSQCPLYRIEKNPKLARRQGAYSVITPTGLILKRGPDLARVLAVLDKSVRMVEH